MPFQIIDPSSNEAVSEESMRVRDDLVNGLGGTFDVRESGFRVASRSDGSALEVSAPEGDLHVVAWELDATPLPGSGLPEQTIVLRGTTFFDAVTEEFARYIDWHSAFVDLGIAGAARRVALG